MTVRRLAWVLVVIAATPARAHGGVLIPILGFAYLLPFIGIFMMPWLRVTAKIIVLVGSALATAAMYLPIFQTTSFYANLLILICTPTASAIILAALAYRFKRLRA